MSLIWESPVWCTVVQGVNEHCTIVMCSACLDTEFSGDVLCGAVFSSAVQYGEEIVVQCSFIQ